MLRKGSTWGEGLGPWVEVEMQRCIVQGKQGLRSSWTTEGARARVSSQPFAEGGMRRAFQAEVEFDAGGPVRRFVFKLSLQPSTAAELRADAHMQSYAQWWAMQYNDRKPPKPVRFLDAFIVSFDAPYIIGGGEPVVLCAAEPFVDGPYVKHNSNAGWADHQRNTPHAFSHFTFEQSNGQVIIVDVQGVDDCYTDPQVHTRNGEGFGMGNCGMLGMYLFFSKHCCSELCSALALPVGAVQLDPGHGTLPRNPADACDQWLKRRAIDPKAPRWTFSSVTLPDCLEIETLLEAAAQHSETLCELTLSGCGMRDKHATRVMAALDNLPGLTYLNLSSNRLTDRVCRELAHSLEHKSLRTLDLCANVNMSAAGLRVIITAPAAKAGSLQLLLFAGNDVSPTEAEQLCLSALPLVVLV